MCGIVVALADRKRVVLKDVLAMNDALRHRGPDDEGYALLADGALRFLTGPDTPRTVPESMLTPMPAERATDRLLLESSLIMGHRRLAIVDLSALGHQPMHREGLTIVFNGEIYNHFELRAELEQLGERFVSHSDTEVLLAAYARWGHEAWSRLNGMWALAIHDERRRRLVVCRDRFGVKPLYVWRGADGLLLFASEAKALRAHPAVAGEPDLDVCAGYLRHGAQAWTGATEFKGITRFPAGHWAEVDLDQPPQLRPLPYWAWPRADDDALRQPFDPVMADRLAAQYRDLLDDAVRLRMRMDVRFGTALSGGLDSSQIASRVNAELLRRGAGQSQEVFSSVYGGSGMATALRVEARRADESAFVAAMSTHLGVRSSTIEPRWQDIPAEHGRMIWALDTPPDNTLMSSWHTYALVARQGVVVTLDGQGADEQLGGYLRYVRNRLIHADAREAWNESRALARNATGAAHVLRQSFVAHPLRHLLGRRLFGTLSSRLRSAAHLELELPHVLANDFSTSLRTLLHYADQSAMAWSVESRMPFMDWRLVEFLAQVPTSYKIHDGWTKWLARHAMRDELPASVVWRRDKMGWAIPESAWVGRGAPLEGWLAEAVGRSAFVRDIARTVGVDFGRAALHVRIRMLNLAVWHRLHHDTAPADRPSLGRGVGIGAAE